MLELSPKPGQKVAMISSTALDLPEHRQQAIDACLRQSVFPIAMENLPARDADAIRVSEEMVDKADIYIGIFAWRYGHVPEGRDISITEIEFNRAVERGIPILVFTIHDEHPLTIKMVETDNDAQQKLASLKERASRERGRREFKSPEELRGEIVHALADLKEREQKASGEKAAASFHPPNVIPEAPKPYIAHPYTLLQTSEVVGRREELKLLTDWVTANKEIPPGIRLFNVVAIGGMGKSALTWKWFNDIAPNELPRLKGRMWWSFYESDAYFENFVTRALAYTAGMTEATVRELPAHEREDRLFHLLDQQPFLLVLDGLERILLAYARMDAAHLLDDDLDEQTANEIARYYGLPDEVKETYLEKHRLRQCADPRAGRFLQRLACVRASRVLVSTRLYPAELQTMTAQPLPGCYPLFLSGLTDDDALALWREFIGSERSGTSEQLLPLFNAFGNYPLLVRALAGRVANYRPAPGDYDVWRKDHPGFNPAAELDLRNAKTHVLHYALEGLGEAQRQVLHTLAAFRMPATWDTLRAVLMGEDKPCRDDRALDDVLTELEDRGLVGWDRRANRYDLHPLVRSVVWSGLDNELQRGIYTSLHAHFAAVPKINDDEISHLEDLIPAIEFYNTLIGLGLYDAAYKIFYQRLNQPMLYRLSANRQRVELIEMLFPDGVDHLPSLLSTRDQAFTLNALAIGYQFCGQPGRSISLFRHQIHIRLARKDHKDLSIGLRNLSDVLRLSGALYESEFTVRDALIITRKQDYHSNEAISLAWVGQTLMARGEAKESEVAMQRSLRMFKTQSYSQYESFVNSCLAQGKLWLDEFSAALFFANRAWKLAQVRNHEAEFIYAARVQGAAALGLGNFVAADELLHHALTRARQVNLVEEELPALIALAELRRQQGKLDEAREYLDAVWDGAARGPYPLYHADALNVLAQLERELGHREAAIAAATAAYQKAWCDGPPYAYHFGLTNARRHLRKLGAPEPELPPFDAAKYEPMPDVELNPKDEFYVEISEVDSEV